MEAEKKPRSAVDIIKQYATSVRTHLPVFPGVAFELQQLLADDNVSLDDISKVISKDQYLASQVLKLANSALFSGPTKINTIRDATMRLGLNHVFNLVVCTSQQSHYKSSNATLNTYLQASWKHALCCAIGSKWLVQELGFRELKDEAFLGGLLHDIGKLVLIKALETISVKKDDLMFPDAFIAKVLASLHAEQGYELMDEWGIPEIYCKIALDHHKQDCDTEDVLLMSVRVVNNACTREGISTHPETDIDLLQIPEVLALGIKADVLYELENVITESIASEFNA